MGPGTRLGRYEIITHIASGGMASVYLARMTAAAGFQRLVAVKRMHGHIAGDENFVAMFMDEARLAARIRHPNVVPTLDLENGEDGLYLAMEFVRGDSLLGLLRAAAKRSERLPPSIGLRIIIDALHGLDAAHELKDDLGEPLNLVHRDVSPHNILVGDDGVARITDFGVARAEERVTHTREGQIKGKLAYMAPEMTAGEGFDRRADVFSTAIVLWECLTGRRLFKGGSDVEVLRSLIDAPIPHVRDVAPEYPRSLDAVVAKALERDPKNRYATAGELADALESAGASLGIAGPRAVATCVKDLAGEQIERMNATVRAWTEGEAQRAPFVAIAGGAIPLVSHEAKENPDTAIRPTATVEAPALPPAHAPMLAGPLVMEPQRPANRALVLALVAAALVVLGAVLASLTLLLVDKPAPAVTSPATTTTTARPEAAATDAPASPSTARDDTPTFAATALPKLGSRPNKPVIAATTATSAARPAETSQPAPPMAQASTATSATAATTPAQPAPTTTTPVATASARPAPSASSFNPTAM